MKLKTKIILSSCIVFGVALSLSEFVTWGLIRNNMVKQAVFQGYQKSYDTFTTVKKKMDGLDAEGRKKYLEFYFKEKRENYSVCYEAIVNKQSKNEEVEINNTSLSVTEVYNHTVFTYEQLAGLHYQEYALDKNMQYENESSCYLAKMEWKGRNYIVYAKNVYGRFFLYRLEDVTYVYDQMIQWAIIMAGISGGMTLLTMLFMWFVLKIHLKPVGELSQKTKRIAQGCYDERIEIKRKDEIGQLGENFNLMAEAVENRTNRLKESEQKKTIFMGDLTHELKTPMTAISGYAQTLLTVKLSEEDREEALTYIAEQCKRLERLSGKMTRLLELGQTTDIDIKKQPVRELFEQTVKSCRAILEKKNITLEIEEHGEHLRMDLDLMTNVLINLVDNAVKASSPGGKIILRTFDQGIAVQDFGCGIEKEEQEKILEPFYMVDKSRSRKNGGAGLGLSLVVLILQKHHVTMQIESALEKGSTFLLTFPEEN